MQDDFPVPFPLVQLSDAFPVPFPMSFLQIELQKGTYFVQTPTSTIINGSIGRGY